MPKIHLISDTHFNHNQMIIMCNRPTDFEKKLCKSLLQVPENDILIHLGDICMGKDEEMHKRFIMPLKCKKILVKGNHDNKSNSWYLDHGWDFVCDYFVDIYFGKIITFSHRPMLDHVGDHNIHGHLHNTTHRVDLYNKSMKGGVLIAVELTNYQTVILNQKLLSNPYLNNNNNG